MKNPSCTISSAFLTATTLSLSLQFPSCPSSLVTTATATATPRSIAHAFLQPNPTTPLSRRRRFRSAGRCYHGGVFTLPSTGLAAAGVASTPSSLFPYFRGDGVVGTVRLASKSDNDVGGRGDDDDDDNGDNDDSVKADKLTESDENDIEGKVKGKADDEANVDVSDDEAFFAALNARREELKSKSNEIRGRWVGANCASSVRVTIDDWVRRLDLRRWPIAAIGTSRGSIRVIDLERGSVLARTADGAHPPVGGNPNANRLLYGKFDGGGTLAVCMWGDTVVSAGREGGAKAWRYDREMGELVPGGMVRALGNSVVSALTVDGTGRLWAATFRTLGGTVYRFDLLEEEALSEQEPRMVKLTSGALCLAVNDEVGLAAVGTAGGTVELISTEDGSVVGSWDVCNLDATPKEGSVGVGVGGGGGGASSSSSATYVRSVEIFHAGLLDEDDSKNNKWCVACGCGDGTVRIHWLRTEDGQVPQPSSSLSSPPPFDPSRPALSLPRHGGMVVSLAACRKNGAGMLISGAQDGTLRVWDFSDDPLGEGDEFSSELDAGTTGSREAEASSFQPLALYQLVGYKVWLGSVCVDDEGLRLVSDGADNTVVVHDFSSGRDD